MEKKLLWFFVVALLAANILLLLQREQERKAPSGRPRLEADLAAALTKTAYAEEEEALVVGTGAVPPTFPGLQTDAVNGDSVRFFLFASVEDCTNCIEDEVLKLNEIVATGLAGKISGVRGFFVDEERRDTAQQFIAHLSPQPLFPMTVKDAISRIPPATTPLVLVVRAQDGKILDAHKPIPQDLTKRDTFYARWAALTSLGLDEDAPPQQQP